jgi:hypothetical protein
MTHKSIFKCKCEDCRLARNAYHKEWKRTHPESTRASMVKAELKRKYGLTPEERDHMIARQGGLCAVCGTNKPAGRHGLFNVDHNHKTGQVRAMLCTACNHGIGKFFDSPHLLHLAAEYLEAYA